MNTLQLADLPTLILEGTFEGCVGKLEWKAGGIPPDLPSP
jgi:hypothetical protein